jgi:ClpP class serine protease
MAKEEKVKEIPWTEKKLMYKDGNVDVFRYFNWETWKRMVEGERAMWTELNESTPAPISKEVIEFNKKATKPITDAAGQQVGTEVTTTGGVIDIMEAEKDIIKKQLKELGIRFTHNSKLETLKKKLLEALRKESADADNSE